MGKPTGFMEFPRKSVPYRDARERTNDFREIFTHGGEDHLRNQSGRCMDCGVPFCHTGTPMVAGQGGIGCPLNNIIPDWNDLVYRDRWREAIDRLHATNNFPEFTGTLCPAPCEAACVLAINDDAVTIKQRHGWQLEMTGRLDEIFGLRGVLPIGARQQLAYQRRRP